jgi:hypothetical protein
LAELTNPSFNAEQLLCQWQQHQVEWLDQEAEAIRNGLLQDLFAVRRKLELQDQDVTACIVDFEQLYAALQRLADRLSSPFLHDSLPLAIQHALSPWPDRIPLKLDLPSHWPHEPVAVTALLLSILDTVLNRLATMHPDPAWCTLSLTEAEQGKQLTLQVNYETAIPLALQDMCQAEPWLYRLRTFEIMTGGKTTCLPRANLLEIQLTW